MRLYFDSCDATVSRWKFPRLGWLKLNTDGGVDVESEIATVEYLLRDHKRD